MKYGFEYRKEKAMYNVLIIEDEILARIGLRQLIPWEKYDFSLLPDAIDGQEALDRIREYRPDIILLDLNIPKIDGLQILKHLKEEAMESKVIVVSCNEEFDMVKEAMKLGAYDYLRKLNLSSEELLGILKKCQQELHMDSKKTEKLSSFSFHDIRYGEIMSPSGKDIFLNVGTYRTAVCILPSSDTPEESAYRTADTAKKWFAEQSVEYMQVIKSLPFCFFLFEQRFSDGFFPRLHQELVDKFHGKFYFGIHEAIMGDVDAVNQSIILSEQIAVISYYDEEAEIHHFPQKIVLKEHSPKGIQQMLSGLKDAVDTFTAKDAISMIRQIFCTIRSAPYVHINVLRRIFMDMLGIYSMTAQKLNGAIEEIEVRKDNCHYQKLMMMNSLNMIENWFLEFQDTFYEQFFIAYKCSQSDILRSVLSYIDSHLTKQVHLSEAAKEIGVSNAYLSTVFKKEMGINFIEYANQKKVAFAKQMLDEGKLVYEVSEILGFENCTYFSKVFKKYEGISPDAYKKKE